MIIDMYLARMRWFLIAFGLILIEVPFIGFALIILGILGFVLRNKLIKDGTYSSSFWEGKNKFLVRFRVTSTSGNKAHIESNSDDSSSYLDVDAIKDKNGFYQDKLISKELKRLEFEAKKAFERKVKNEDCHGMRAKCNSCNYVWTIRKEKSIPALCPRCQQRSISVPWSLNEDVDFY